MRVNTKVVIDIATLEVIERESCNWFGEVHFCKGSETADSQRKQELAMQQQAFDVQQKQLAFLNDKLSPYLTGEGQGFTNQQNAQLQSQFLNNNALQFNAAGQNVRQALAARGGGLGDAPVSGDYARGLEGLFSAGASSQAAGLQNLGLANAQQALANKFNAASVLSGNAATLNGAQSVAGSGASSALQSYITAKNSGLLQSFVGALGQGIGGGLGAFATGGLGSLASSIGKSSSTPNSYGIG